MAIVVVISGKLVVISGSGKWLANSSSSSMMLVYSGKLGI